MNFDEVRQGGVSFLARLAELFSEMDAAYEKVAGLAGFVCRGCEDNCCETRFHHHTLLEVFFLVQGFGNLPGETREKIRDLAQRRCLEMAEYDENGSDKPYRSLCPLNDGTLCMLYGNRPMVCRFHGVPWKMQGRNGEVVGPGCDLFEKTRRERGARALPLLDRTGYYRRFARLEQEFREFTHFNGKIGMTISEILCLEGMEGSGGKIP